MNPTEDGTESRITVTLQLLQSWRDVRAKLLQMEKGTLSPCKGAVAGHQHWVICALSSGSMVVDAKTENKRKISDGVLMVV